MALRENLESDGYIVHDTNAPAFPRSHFCLLGCMLPEKSNGTPAPLQFCNQNEITNCFYLETVEANVVTHLHDIEKVATRIYPPPPHEGCLHIPWYMRGDAIATVSVATGPSPHGRHDMT